MEESIKIIFSEKIYYFILEMEGELDLGWCQGYMALQYHMEEALIEQKRDTPALCDPPFAIFSRKYYTEMQDLDHEKKHDFCFIGSIRSNPQARQWVIDFAKKYFTKNSVFINSDNDPSWESLGDFDFTNKILGYCPKNVPDNQSKKVQYRVIKENIQYFETFCRSKFVLCPAGDSSWSFRFYEVLMCKSIPIVESWHHTYRTREEATLNYKYVLYQDIENVSIPYEDYVEENTKIFEKYHLLN